MTPPTIETDRTIMTVLHPDHAHAMLDFQLRNREHVGQWEPARDAAYLTLDATCARCENAQRELAEGTALYFIAQDRASQRIVAQCNFFNIRHGAFMGCSLGYMVDVECQGAGLMREVVRAGIDHMFEVVGLHRIMAQYMPANTRSEKLLQKLGFEREGLARAYLYIAGKWEDMVLTSLINPDDVNVA